MKKIILLFLILVTVSACGSLNWSFFSKKKDANDDSEVAKEFNLSDDVITKFQEKPVEDSKSKSQPEKKVSPKKESVKNKKVLSSKSKKNKSKKEIKKTKEIKKNEVDEYPKELLALSKKAALHWKNLNLDIFKRKGEKMFMEADFAGITMGKMVISNEGTKTYPVGEVVVLKADVKTSPFYKYLYELEGEVTSDFLLEKKVPIKFRFDQVEKGKKRNDLQYYDFENRKTISLYKKVQDGKVKKKHLEAPIPYPYIDSFSIINYLRAFPLKKGQKFTIPLIHKAKILKFKISVDDIIDFDSKIGKKRAFLINADSNFSGDTLKSGKITFWIADDKTRALLQARVKIKIGSIYLKLDKYQP